MNSNASVAQFEFALCETTRAVECSELGNGIKPCNPGSYLCVVLFYRECKQAGRHTSRTEYRILFHVMNGGQLEI